ncbi:MAG: DUF1993 domain-containing protein [Bdellovibrionaceae bacterium]|nr:DUF1993 domain-containing protein [Bdellovibrio sp.]
MNKHYVNQFIKTLTALDGIMAKAAAHADARKFDVNNFMTERLAPDMLTFASQVRIACDNAKITAATFSKNTPPKYEDNEKTWAELRTRIKTTTDYLKTLQEADFTNFKDVKCTPTWAGGQWLKGDEAFYELNVPNFYFHVTMAYAILRKAGVELGKGDFIGGLNFQNP